MKQNDTVYTLYGDQLGSMSAVADADGLLISKTLYEPWGKSRYQSGTSPTDYAYTGHTLPPQMWAGTFVMQEGEIYFYNACYYDLQPGRFMQADTLVPPSQGTQGFDRYAYVNNNPLRYTDRAGIGVVGINTILPVPKQFLR